MNLNRKKIWKWTTNALLAAIILILFIPSWRIVFQGFWGSLFLSDAEFKQSTLIDADLEVRNWPLWNMESELIVFGQLHGKPVLLAFWATWCVPCRTELNELAELKEEMKSEIQILAVSTEPLKIIEDSGLNEDFDFLYYSDGTPAQIAIISYPTLFIFNSDLKIVYKSSGAANLNTAENINFLRNL